MYHHTTQMHGIALVSSSMRSLRTKWTTSFEVVHQIELSETVCGSSNTDLQVTQSKLTFRHAWHSLQLEPKYRHLWSYDAGFCQLIQRSSSSNSYWTKEIVLTRTEELMSRWYANAWTQNLNEGAKLLQPQIRKSWDSMENANKKRK